MYKLKENLHASTKLVPFLPGRTESDEVPFKYSNGRVGTYRHEPGDLGGGTASRIGSKERSKPAICHRKGHIGYPCLRDGVESIDHSLESHLLPRLNRHQDGVLLLIGGGFETL